MEGERKAMTKYEPSDDKTQRTGRGSDFKVTKRDPFTDRTKPVTDDCMGSPDCKFTLDSDHPLRGVIFHCANKDCKYANVDRDEFPRKRLTGMHTEPYGTVHCPGCGGYNFTMELTAKLEKEVFGSVS